MQTTTDWDDVKERARRELSSKAYYIVDELLEFAEPSTTVDSVLDHLTDWDWIEFQRFDHERWDDAREEAYVFIQGLDE